MGWWRSTCRRGRRRTVARSSCISGRHPFEEVGAIDVGSLCVRFPVTTSPLDKVAVVDDTDSVVGVVSLDDMLADIVDQVGEVGRLPRGQVRV